MPEQISSFQTNPLEQGFDLPVPITKGELTRIENEGDIVSGCYLMLEVAIGFAAEPFGPVSLDCRLEATNRTDSDPVPRQTVFDE